MLEIAASKETMLLEVVYDIKNIGIFIQQTLSVTNRAQGCSCL